MNRETVHNLAVVIRDALHGATDEEILELVREMVSILACREVEWDPQGKGVTVDGTFIYFPVWLSGLNSVPHKWRVLDVERYFNRTVGPNRMKFKPDYYPCVGGVFVGAPILLEIDGQKVGARVTGASVVRGEGTQAMVDYGSGKTMLPAEGIWYTTDLYLKKMGLRAP